MVFKLIFTNFLIEAVGGYNELEMEKEVNRVSESEVIEKEMRDEDENEPQASKTERSRCLCRNSWRRKHCVISNTPRQG